MSFAKTLSRDEMRNIMAGGGSSQCIACCDSGGNCGCCTSSVTGCAGVDCGDDYTCQTVNCFGSDPCPLCEN